PPQRLHPQAQEDARRSLTTSLDVARSAIRAGVADVTVVALESPQEIPAAPEEIAEAEEEGIRIVYRRGPHRIVGQGVVEGLETIGVASVFDAQHRFAPTFVPDTEEVLPADTVILAVGQLADVGFLGEHAGVELTRQGGVAVDRTTLRTSHPRVWAGGDVAFGPRNLIDAIADGQRAAASIHAEHTGGAAGSRRIELVDRPGFRRLASGYDAVGRVEIPVVPHDRRIGFAEGETGYDEAEGRLEGHRCLRCFDNVMLQPELCILCGLCVDVCPHNCITIVPADRAGGGTAARPALLREESLCIRCGLCVNRCPPGALLMVYAKEPADGSPGPRPARARHLPAAEHAVAARAAERGVAVRVPPPAARHPTGPCAAVVQQLLPARLPGEGARQGAALPLLVAARLHPDGAVRDPEPDRHVPDVLLHAIDRRRLRRHAAAPHRG